MSSSLVEAAAGLPEKGLMVCKWLGTGSAGYGGYKACMSRTLISFLSFFSLAF